MKVVVVFTSIVFVLLYNVNAIMGRNPWSPVSGPRGRRNWCHYYWTIKWRHSDRKPSPKIQKGPNLCMNCSRITNMIVNAHDPFQTYIGTMVIAVNPYKKLSFYSPEVIAAYQHHNIIDLPPHMSDKTHFILFNN